MIFNTQAFHQDYFFDRKWIFQHKGNWENPGAILWDEMKEQIRQVMIHLKEKKQHILIIEGFLLFALEELNSIFDIKIWIEISEDIMYNRRMSTTTVPEVYFHLFLWPEYESYRKKSILPLIENSSIHQIEGTLPKVVVVQQALDLIFDLFSQMKSGKEKRSFNKQFFLDQK
ncbi:hypothetical protein M0811_02145 [Anaeramoeba ignava]|uniref:Phosphoribulokinase/uridine kinase domain-containing protein n=1 Tax=Anaeramoeba ignava TaxID=1746090 RepID=A0A9Q0LE36_ANAIG|nr:hypothetical protein M0811_02145 [Anaeramoeba ignava]